MESEQLQKLWQHLERERGRYRLRGLHDLLSIAKEHDLAPTLEDLRALAARMQELSEGVCPAIVAEFIVDCVSGRAAQAVLDPWSHQGTLLLPVVRSLKPERTLAICPNVDQVEIARYLDADGIVSWCCADPVKRLDEESGSFDLIVSCPPFGLRPSKERYDTPEAHVSVHDDAGNHALLKSCRLLTDGGKALFVVHPGFVSPSKTNGVYANMSRFGLRVEAYIGIPAGTFVPWTGIPTGLVLIGRGDRQPIFVAALAGNRDRNRVLIENMLARREGKELALGSIVDPQTFRGFEPLAAQERITRMAARSGLDPIPFADVFSEVNLTASSDPTDFENKPNAVYLPLIGRSDAVSSLSELTLKPHNYAQLIIDFSREDEPEYIAAFFNSPLGHVVRESACSGVTIPKITKKTLSHIDVFLPPPEIQRNALDAHSRIRGLVAELTELQQRMWMRPRTVDQTVRELNRVNNEERFTDWLASLPFPLATILWAYHAENVNFHKKLDHLDHFFEALAEFLATLFLSAFVRDDEIFKAERDKLRDALSRHHLSVERSTFGTWVKVAERLGKRARTMLNGAEEERARCKRLFMSHDHELLQSLLSSKLVGIMQDTNALRNDWRGHGGVVGDSIVIQRLDRLGVYLTKARECFGDMWSRYQLYRPREMKFVEGTFSVSADMLVGLATPFETVTIQTSEPLEHGHLYFFADGETRGLKLLPLIRVLPSPDTAENACYFYNRRQSDGVRFVSYHFEGGAEVVRQDNETEQVLGLLQAGQTAANEEPQ